MLVGLVLLAAVPGACRRDVESARGRGTFTIVASFFPLAEVARTIVGDEGGVVDLTPSGVEPHDYELKPSAIDRALDADVLVVLGGGFQPEIERVASRRAHGVVRILPAKTPDPHVWLDPLGMGHIVDEVTRGVARAQRDRGHPRAARAAQARAARLKAALNALDAEFRRGLTACATRTIISAHGAFGRLAARYDLEQVAIAGIDPSAEPSAGHLNDVAALARDKRVTTVFTERLVSPAVAASLARETGLRTAVLDPIEGGRPGSYVSLMRRDLAALRQALDCR